MRTDQTDRRWEGHLSHAVREAPAPFLRIQPARSVFSEMIEMAWVGMLGTIAERLENLRERAVGRVQ